MSLMLFMCAMFVGVLSLAVALALALTELLAMPIVAWLIVALLFIVVAVVIYYISLHTTIKRINRRLDTIYEVSATVEMCFHKVALYLRKITDSLFR